MGKTGSFKSIAIWTLVIGLVFCQVADGSGESDPEEVTLNPETVIDLQTGAEDTPEDPYRFCDSDERNICRLHPSKYEKFIADQICAVLLFEAKPTSEVKRVIRRFRKRFADIAAKCIVGWVDLSLEPSFSQTHAPLPSGFVLHSSTQEGFLEYHSKLSDLAIFRWAIKNVYDIVHPIANLEELEGFYDLKSFGLLVNPSGNKDLKDQYHAFCRKITDLNFVESSADEVAQKFETGDDPTLFLVSAHANRTDRLVLASGVLDEAKARQFIQDKRRTDVFNGTMSFEDLLKWKEPIVARVRNATTPADSKFRDFARRFNGIDNPTEDPAHAASLDALMPKGFIMEDLWVNFYEVTTDDNMAGWLQYYVGRESTNPDEDWIVIVQKESDQYQKWYLPSWDHASLLKALKDLSEGKLEQFFKTQISASQEKPPVVGLTSTTLESLVIQKPGSALVIGYSPRCGFCVEGRQIIQKIATEFEGTPNFGVYEIDVTENDHASFHIESYPKLIFYQDGDKMDPEIFEAESFGQVEEFLEKRGIVSPKKVIAGEL